MIDEFQSVLKLVCETGTMFEDAESFIRDPDFRSAFHIKFYEYCLKNELKEVLYLYLDHHR